MNGYTPLKGPLTAETFSEGSVGTRMSALQWYERANAKNFALNAVAWDGTSGRIVAVGGADGTDAYIVTSDDGGVSWTERANPKNFALNAVAWNGALWVAVGGADGADAYIVTSPDGVTWTERSNVTNIGLNGVAWSSTLSLWVAVGDDAGGDAYILTSPDGTTWTERAPAVAKAIDLNAIAWNGTAFAAVGDADGADGYILRSTDGTTWTEASNAKNFGLLCVAWASDLSLFVAAGAADGSDAYLLTSPDGTAWSERANPANFALHGAVWTGSHFYAVGAADGVDPYRIRSVDGVTWEATAAYAPGHGAKNFALNALVFTGANLVAVGGADGADAYLLTQFHHFAVPYRGQPQRAQAGADISFGNLLDALDYSKADAFAILLSDADQNVTPPAGGARYYMTPTVARTVTIIGTNLGVGDLIEFVNLGGPAFQIQLKASDTTSIGYVVLKPLNLRVKSAAPTINTSYLIENTGWEFIETQTASASAVLDFTKGFGGAYDEYILVGSHLLPALDGEAILMRVSEDGGSTWKAGASDYACINEGLLMNITEVELLTGDEAFDAIRMLENIGNAVNEGVHRMEVHITRPNGGGHVALTGVGTFRNNVGNRYLGSFGGQYYGSTNAVNGLRLFYGNGNTTSGSASLFGMRAA